MIELGDEQKQALIEIESFLSSEEVTFSLIGYAGTGKSFLIKHLVEYLENNKTQYALCAPTHKAKVVLERFTEREGVTLHKLLSLSPNIEILNLDFKDLKFLMNDNTKFISLFPYDGVIICDESSMVNDELFKLLEDKCRSYNTKIIFVGDKAQLKPVNSFECSKVFNLKNKFELTKIYRQSSENGLNSVLPTLRNNIVQKFYTHNGIEGSLICNDDIKDFFKQSIEYYQKAIKNSDILEVKMLAYTNARVNAFNKKLKEILFPKNEYNQFEFLTGYENLEFNKNKFWNSMDYIIIDKPLKTEVYIHNFIKLPGYKLNLYDSSSKTSNEVFIISREISEDYLNSLSAHIENTRLCALEAKKNRSRNSGRMWQEYYKIIGSFTSPFDLYFDNRLIRKKSFDYGYAMSIHKSQGSSINNVFIDMKNILQCRDTEEIRQMQYVSISRAKNNAYILQ